jgi:hypothetical protein
MEKVDRAFEIPLPNSQFLPVVRMFKRFARSRYMSSDRISVG